MACTRGDQPTLVGAAAVAALGSGLRLDWGSVKTVANSDAVGIVVADGSPTSGWQLAHWLVAHSETTSVQRVRFGDREWTAEGGVWRDASDPTGDAARVVAEVYR